MGGGGCILHPLYVRGLKGLMIRVLILTEEIFYSLETMKVAVIGCGHIWDLTLVKGFNRGKKDVKKLYYSKTH